MRRRRSHRPRLALVGITLVALALALVAPGVVLGHSQLESADPAANSTVTESPTLIVANFTEKVDATRSSMELRGPDGAVIAKGGVAPGDPEAVQMTITPPASLGPGMYEVRWTTVTADDNGIERGTYTITVAAAPTAPATAVASPSASAEESVEPSASAEASESPEPSVAPSAPASPSASASGSGGSGGGTGDSGPNVLLIAVAIALLAVVVAVAAFVAVRGRRT